MRAPTSEDAIVLRHVLRECGQVISLGCLSEVYQCPPSDDIVTVGEVKAQDLAMRGATDALVAALLRLHDQADSPYGKRASFKRLLGLQLLSGDLGRLLEEADAAVSHRAIKKYRNSRVGHADEKDNADIVPRRTIPVDEINAAIKRVEAFYFAVTTTLNVPGALTPEWFDSLRDGTARMWKRSLSKDG